MSDLNTPGSASTPPVNPGESTMFDLPEPQTWPKPVGITSIVLGAFNLCCVGCVGVGIAMQTIFAEQMAEQFPDGMPPQAMGVSIPMAASLALGTLVDVLLIVAGSMLLMRRPVARTLHLAYGVLGLIGFAIGVIISVQMQVEMTEWIKQNSTTKFAQQQQATGWIGQMIGWVFQIVLGFLWPVFCLIWFGLVKKKSADITQGVDAVM